MTKEEGKADVLVKRCESNLRIAKTLRDKLKFATEQGNTNEISDASYLLDMMFHKLVVES